MTDVRVPLPASPFPLPASTERTGAQVMCEALVRENVEVMFGIPGGAIMPFYHAMWEYRDQLRHVLCRHEQGAGHAAEGYARSTGKNRRLRRDQRTWRDEPRHSDCERVDGQHSARRDHRSGLERRTR